MKIINENLKHVKNYEEFNKINEEIDSTGPLLAAGALMVIGPPFAIVTGFMLCYVHRLTSAVVGNFINSIKVKVYVKDLEKILKKVDFESDDKISNSYKKL